MKDEIRPHYDTNQPPPTLEYARVDASHGPRLRWWPSVISIVLVLVFVPGFMCACGHLGVEGFIATVPAFGLACYGWIGNKHKNLLWRTFLILAVLLAFRVLFKNIVDVLWLGHNPLLR